MVLKLPKRARRGAPEGPKIAQDGPRCPQNGPRGRQDGPIQPQDGPQSPQEASKTPPTGPNGNRPRRQAGPKRSPQASKRRPGPPETPQKAAPNMLQRGPPDSPPERPPETSKLLPRGPLGGTQEDFQIAGEVSTASLCSAAGMAGWMGVLDIYMDIYCSLFR